LGTKNKKETIKRMVCDKNIDVFCMQEIELENWNNADLQSFPNYQLENESNMIKSRVCVYKSNHLKYVRRTDLEGVNAHLVIVDIKVSVGLRIINIFRCFNPQEGITPKEKFLIQLNLIKSAITQHTILLGDFNMDYSKRFDVGYRLRDLFGSFDELLGDVGLMQLVNFPTWSRVVQNTYRDSIPDHVYCSNPFMIDNMQDKQPTFGDHKLIIFSLQCEKSVVGPIMRRDWRKYSRELFNSKLVSVNWDTEIDSVQQYWNVFEEALVSVVDEIAPMVPFVNNTVSRSQVPAPIKNKLNKRRRLLRTIKTRPCN
jgi:endonuclease/exonuclease/phosphatase family metal-dependent hydrolase